MQIIRTEELIETVLYMEIYRKLRVASDQFFNDSKLDI